MRERHQLRVKVTRRPTEAEIAAGAGRFDRIPDGWIVGDVDLTIDRIAILETLGARALHNRGKRAGAMGGLVVAKASNIRREKGEW